MGAGCPALQAQASVGIASVAQTATGASQNSLALPSDFVVYTASTLNNGPTLPAVSALGFPGVGDSYIVVNHSGNSINVWPPTGGKIANGSANAAFAVANNKTAFFLHVGSGNYAASLSA